MKTDSERISLELREEMGLRPSDPLDPFALGELLCIPIFSFADCAEQVGDAKRIHLLRTKQRRCVSAMTVVNGSHRIILYNDSNAAVRSASDICHEFGHILLEHPSLVVSARDWHEDRSPQMEQEATWLGGTLLLPRTALLYHLGLGCPEADLAQRFGVSRRMLQWRINATGVRKQLERRARM